MAEEKAKPLTHEDVLRLIKENGGTAEGLDLSGKVFEEGIDLRKFDLRGIILSNAVLWDAHLEEAEFRNAHLEKTDLARAHLEESNLSHTHLEEAEFWNAHLEGANLFGAYLQGAYFMGAHLEGAILRLVKLSPDTELAGVKWGNYILREEIRGAFDLAAETYRRLKAWHDNAGYSNIAAKFYYREKEANRKALKLFSKSSWRHRLALELIYRGWGYGEGWKRLLFGWIPGVILVLAAAYYFWGSFSSSSFWDTLYYSAASFTALGYGNWAPQPTGWAKGMGAVEAIIGVFMMALLLVTFVRKWTR